MSFFINLYRRLNEGVEVQCRHLFPPAYITCALVRPYLCMYFPYNRPATAKFITGLRRACRVNPLKTDFPVG